jgi:hypothetical protein
MTASTASSPTCRSGVSEIVGAIPTLEAAGRSWLMDSHYRDAL